MKAYGFAHSQVEMADYHRSSPYEHEETAVASQSSILFPACLTVGKPVVVVTPIKFPTCSLPVFSDKEDKGSAWHSREPLFRPEQNPDTLRITQPSLLSPKTSVR